MHTGLPVAGYKQQPEEAVALVNMNKVQEELLLRRMDALIAVGGVVDPRWMAIARAHIEHGFMAWNRAIFQPGRIALPEDGESGERS